MEEKDREYCDKFEANLIDSLLKLCTSFGKLDGILLSSEDIDQKWKEIAPEYMADAVPQINSFPEAALGWAGYIGLAVAKYWDQDWGGHHNDKYTDFYGPRGFDDMDDHIVTNVLGHPVNSTQAGAIRNLMLSCTQLVLSSLRNEHPESHSKIAFHLIARSMRALFRIGAALELKDLGYKYQKIEFKRPLNQPQKFS